MPVSTDAPPTWTWARSERSRLTGEALPVAALSPCDRDQMFALFARHFDGACRDRFEADLAEKDVAIVLRETSSSVCGFSTLMRVSVDLEGRLVPTLFSGDTIVDPSCWGDSVLSALWGKVAYGEVDRLAKSSPDATLYWMLICAGYKTWRFLPVFFRAFSPSLSGPMPVFEARLRDAFGVQKFGTQYLRERGIVRFTRPTPLRPGVADVTDARLRDPAVRFFVDQNPGHLAGDELVCVAPLTHANLTKAGRRMVEW